METSSWNSRHDDLREAERAYGDGEGGSRAGAMNEALMIGSLDLQRLLWTHETNGNYEETDQYSLRQQDEEEMFGSDQPLRLPLIAGSSEDLQLIRNILTFSSSCGDACSGESEKRPDSFGIKPGVPAESKKARPDCPEDKNIDFRRGGGGELDGEAIARVKEMIYRAAALRPVSFGAEEMVERPRRKNLRISNDPQTTAARRRRERISERLRALQRLVPGGRKMDTASMLDEAANYLKFLKAQVNALEKNNNGHAGGLGETKNVAGLHCCGGLLPFPVALSRHSSPMQACIPPLPRH